MHFKTLTITRTKHFGSEYFIIWILKVLNHVRPQPRPHYEAIQKKPSAVDAMLLSRVAPKPAENPSRTLNAISRK